MAGPFTLRLTFPRPRSCLSTFHLFQSGERRSVFFSESKPPQEDSRESKFQTRRPGEGTGCRQRIIRHCPCTIRDASRQSQPQRLLSSLNLGQLQIPNGEDAVKRAADLVKPGGFLIIDDVDLASMLHTGGPAVRRHASMMIELFKSRKADGEIGRKLGSIISATGYFPDIQVRKIAVPLSGAGASEQLRIQRLNLTEMHCT